jgi:hypothetical protein
MAVAILIKLIGGVADHRIELEDRTVPVHYVLIRPPKTKWEVLPLTLSNSGSSDEYFIDQLHLIDIPLGSRQLVLISGKYYDSHDSCQGTIQCFLERLADEFKCSVPITPRYSTERQLRFIKASCVNSMNTSALPCKSHCWNLDPRQTSSTEKQ